MTPVARRAAAQVMVEEHRLSRVRTCKAVGLSRSNERWMQHAIDRYSGENSFVGSPERRRCMSD